MVTILSVITIIRYSAPFRAPLLSVGHLVTYLVAFAITMGFYSAVSLAYGISLRGLIDGVLLQHTSFVDLWYRDPQLYYLSAPFAIAATIVAFLPATRRRYPQRLLRIVWLAATVGVGLRVLSDSITPLVHGGMDRGHALLMIGVILPSMWMVLSDTSQRDENIDTSTSNAPERSFAVLFLCLIAVLHPLSGYPIPGTQLAIASLPALIVLLIGIWNQFNQIDIFDSEEKLFRVGPVWFLSVVAIVTLASRCLVNSRIRDQYTPLNVHGAQLLRLPIKEARQIQWAVKHVHAHGNTFLGFPSGFCSLYSWADVEPPTHRNATDWSRLLTAEDQQIVIKKLTETEHICVIRDTRFLDPNPDSPLVHYIQNEFEYSQREGDLELWIRKPD